MFIEKILKTYPNKIIEFETPDGLCYSFDATEYIFGAWMGELNNFEYFSQVQPYFGDSFEWLNGQAISPEDIDEFSVLIKR